MRIRAVLRREMPRVAELAEERRSKGEVFEELPRTRKPDVPVAPLLAVVGAAQEVVRRNVRVLQRLRDVPLGNRVRVRTVAVLLSQPTGPTACIISRPFT